MRVSVLHTTLLAVLGACGGQATSSTPSTAPVTTVALTASASAAASAPASSVPPLPPRASASVQPADPPVPHLEHCVLHAGSGESHMSKPPSQRLPNGQVIRGTGPVTRTDKCSFHVECGIPGRENEGDGDASIRCHDDDCECLVEPRPDRGASVRFRFTESGACLVPHGVQTLLIDRCLAGAMVSNDPRRKRAP